MRKWDEIKCQSMFIWPMFSLIYSNARLFHLSLPVCLYRMFTIIYPCVIDITIFGRSCIIIMFARILVEGNQFRCHWKHQNTEAWMTMFFPSISLPTPQRLWQYHYNGDYYCNINMLIWIYDDYIFISNLYFPRWHHLHARWVLYLAVLTILQLQELSVCRQRGTASPDTDYKALIQRLPVDRRVKKTNTSIQVLRKALVDAESKGCFKWTTLRGCYIMGRFLMISSPPFILGTKASNPGEYSW